jgi:hypothetical protein
MRVGGKSTEKTQVCDKKVILNGRSCGPLGGSALGEEDDRVVRREGGKERTKSPEMGGMMDGGPRSEVIPPRFLQLNHPPAPRLRIVDVLWQPGHADRVGDQLNTILHAGSQVARLRVAVDMHLLRPAGDDEHRNLAGLKHASVQDVDVSNVQNTAVGFQPSGGVLLHQGRVDLELGGGEPEFEGLNVAFDIGVQNFGKCVFS